MGELRHNIRVEPGNPNQQALHERQAAAEAKGVAQLAGKLAQLSAEHGIPQIIAALKSQLPNIEKQLEKKSGELATSLEAAREAGAEVAVTDRYSLDFSRALAVEGDFLGTDHTAINLPNATRLETLAQEFSNRRQFDSATVLDSLNKIQEFFNLAAKLGKAAEQHTGNK